jgi:hypothetical protein
MQPPYPDSFLWQAMESRDSNDPKFSYGMFVRLLINQALYFYRRKHHRDPKKIHLSFDEYDAFVHFSFRTERELGATSIEIKDSARNRPVTQIEVNMDGIPVIISDNPRLLE